MAQVKEKNTANANKDLHLIPQNTDAEEALIGAILVNPVVLTKVVESLKPESFYKPAHRYIYEAMLQLFNSNERIDIVSVSNVLDYSQKLETVGGRPFINDLALNAISTANIEYYSKIIQEKAIKRALINAGSEIVSFGYDVNPIDQSLEQAEKLIFDIASKKATTDLVHVKDLVLNTYEKIEYRYEHKDELSGTPTGFYELDAVLNGLQKSDLLILAARPAMGKTAFALNIAENVAMINHIPTAIFSLEMSKVQLAKRLVAMNSKVDSQRIRIGELEDDEWAKITESSIILGESTLYIDDTGSISINDLRSKCRKLKMEKGLGLIIIDYLQLMSGNSGSKNISRQQEISDISRSLKSLARELDCPVIALSQLSRKVEEREDKRPILSDLRESGAIEQDADVVMFLYRDEYYTKDASTKKGITEIIIGKQRNGPTCTVELKWLNQYTKFANLEYHDE